MPKTRPTKPWHASLLWKGHWGYEMTPNAKGQYIKAKPTSWILENLAGRPTFNALYKRDYNSKIEEVGKKLRAMMKWIDSKEV